MRDAGVRPAKSLGQHFLTDRNIVNRIVEAGDLSGDDVVVEIGPGLGILTERLVPAAGHVIALDLDVRLAERLKQQFEAEPKVTIVQGDALEVDPSGLLTAAGLPPATPYVVVGNLPYNVGTAIVRRLLEAQHPPRRLIVMLQREVAESMVAAPGELGILGVATQVYAQARRLFNVPARAFYPPPSVVSSVIALDVRATPLVDDDEREHFFAVLRAGFSAPRKQLRNTLAQGLGLPPAEAGEAIVSAGLDPSQRPQELSIDNWLRLAKALGGKTS
jgi:16S rRNA (adenine1518-N6/adenine1519-N6)-dimethyltransferase